MTQRLGPPAGCARGAQTKAAGFAPTHNESDAVRVDMTVSIHNSRYTQLDQPDWQCTYRIVLGSSRAMPGHRVNSTRSTIWAARNGRIPR